MSAGKHEKTDKPTDADLKTNPQIGGSKGARAAGMTPDDLDLAQGETTFEGDIENQTNDKGGVDKPFRDTAPLRPRQA
ncbi:hypothetical protein [Azospirillum picis]|uniref:Sugar ABC transporter ATP-binding protein n=1 Tax=Azospirillum picis TaxID=488438 RepID=A0ABU0MM89_9PROT|nr:hypothetical protein [Azospirillum picis]MBP2301021.1 hypothetical protein [Azospirillum picis]MDQ0534359.1 hypothetical protein [Azospirillum picis]